MSDKTAAAGRKMPVFRKATGAMSDILPPAAGRIGGLGRFPGICGDKSRRKTGHIGQDNGHVRYFIGQQRD